MDLNTVKEYLKIDFDDDNDVLEMLLGAARRYVTDAVGGDTLDESDERVKIVLLALVSDWYEHREYMGKASEKVRYTVRSIILQLQCEVTENET